MLLAMKTTKHSKKRDMIYSILCDTKSHPSAEWIYNEAKQSIADLSLATVYRNLALFREQGRAVCVATVNAQERFDANTQPHTHFICSQCGEILDIETIEDFPSYAAQVEEAYNISISKHSLVFYGSCNNCK